MQCLINRKKRSREKYNVQSQDHSVLIYWVHPLNNPKVTISKPNLVTVRNWLYVCKMTMNELYKLLNENEN